MPRVALNDKQRREYKLADGNKALNQALNHFKVDKGLRWSDVADLLNASTTSLSRWRKNPDIIPLSAMRRIVALIKMEPETWAKIGGL